MIVVVVLVVVVVVLATQRASLNIESLRMEVTSPSHGWVVYIRNSTLHMRHTKYVEYQKGTFVLCVLCMHFWYDDLLSSLHSDICVWCLIATYRGVVF